MLKTTRLCVRHALVVMVFACLGCAAHARAPIPAGPQRAGHIHFEFAIYYPEPPAREPMMALQERMRAGEGARNS